MYASTAHTRGCCNRESLDTLVQGTIHTESEAESVVVYVCMCWLLLWLRMLSHFHKSTITARAINRTTTTEILTTDNPGAQRCANATRRIFWLFREKTKWNKHTHYCRHLKTKPDWEGHTHTRQVAIVSWMLSLYLTGLDPMFKACISARTLSHKMRLHANQQQRTTR